MTDSLPEKDSSTVGKTSLEKISRLVPDPELQKLIPVNRINQALNNLHSLDNPTEVQADQIEDN